MKYSKRLARLRERQEWWNRQSDSYKAATTKPGSTKK